MAHQTYINGSFIIIIDLQCGIGNGFIYCLQFYVRLGLESPLDERQIMEDRLSSGIGSMPQTWPR